MKESLAVAGQALKQAETASKKNKLRETAIQFAAAAKKANQKHGFILISGKKSL